MLEHKVRRVGTVFILDLAGRVSGPEAIASDPASSPGLREILLKLFDEGAQNLLVNVKEVSYIDSTGIGVLFGLQTTLQRNGGRLVLLNPNSRLRDIMKLTRLDTLIAIADNEAEAVRSLAKAAGR